MNFRMKSIDSFTILYSLRIFKKVNRYTNKLIIGIAKIKIAKISVLTVRGPLSNIIQRINKIKDE